MPKAKKPTNYEIFKKSKFDTDDVSAQIEAILLYLEIRDFSVKLDAVRSTREWKAEVWTVGVEGSWRLFGSALHHDLLFALTIATINADQFRIPKGDPIPMLYKHHWNRFRGMLLSRHYTNAEIDAALANTRH
jgi:hypothetical protein